MDRLQVGGCAVLVRVWQSKIKTGDGNLLFIGLFLSVIFLLGAVLLIYYKQISEGYEDRDGFVILQRLVLMRSKPSALYVNKSYSVLLATYFLLSAMLQLLFICLV